MCVFLCMCVSESLHQHKVALEEFKETDVSGCFWGRELRNYKLEVEQSGKERESVAIKKRGSVSLN